MSRHEELIFPNDLHNAMTLRGVPLSFSTIQTGDTNPFMNGKGGAEGSVGMLIDLGPNSTLISVLPEDSGSCELGSLGLPPTPQNCADSIDKRNQSNEWVVKDYVPLGIFVLPPIRVRQMVDFEGQRVPDERELQLTDVVAAFLGHPIFSASPRTFLKFDPADRNWKGVSYDDIMPRLFTPPQR
jgi:hypothetical protein